MATRAGRRDIVGDIAGRRGARSGTGWRTAALAGRPPTATNAAPMPTAPSATMARILSFMTSSRDRRCGRSAAGQGDCDRHSAPRCLRRHEKSRGRGDAGGGRRRRGPEPPPAGRSIRWWMDPNDARTTSPPMPPMPHEGPAAVRAAPRRGSRSSRGGGWSTRSGRSRSCRPTTSRRSTARRCGSWPRSASRSSATGRSTPSPARARRSTGRPGASGSTRPRSRRWSRPRPRVHAARPQPGTDIVFGGPNLVFGAVGGPAFVSDLDRGRRAGNFADFVDYVRVIGALDVIHQEGGGPLEPNDLPVETRHLDMYRTFAVELDKTWQCLGFGARPRRRRARGRVARPRRRPRHAPPRALA